MVALEEASLWDMMRNATKLLPAVFAAKVYLLLIHLYDATVASAAQDEAFYSLSTTW